MTDKTATHTPGAIRVAEAITGASYDNRSATMPTAYGRKTTAGIAAMIDDATAAPDLLEACRRAAPWLAKLIADNGHAGSAMPSDAEKALRLIESALDKAGAR